MSDTMTYVKLTIPPPPTPWIERPTSRSAMLLATDAMTVPTMKRKSAKRSTDFRPMMCEKDAHVG